MRSQCFNSYGSFYGLAGGKNSDSEDESFDYDDERSLTLGVFASAIQKRMNVRSHAYISSTPKKRDNILKKKLHAFYLEDKKRKLRRKRNTVTNAISDFVRLFINHGYYLLKILFCVANLVFLIYAVVPHKHVLHLTSQDDNTMNLRYLTKTDMKHSASSDHLDCIEAENEEDCGKNIFVHCIFHKKKCVEIPNDHVNQPGYHGISGDDSDGGIDDGLKKKPGAEKSKNRKKIAEFSYGPVKEVDKWFIDPLKSRNEFITIVKMEWFWNIKKGRQDFRELKCKQKWDKCLKENPARIECDCKRKDSKQIVHFRCMGCTKEKVFKGYN